MPYFTTNDAVRLHYTDDGTGTPVILIAGFRAPSTTWTFQVGHLLSRGYRVLALDRRSHGESEDPEHGHRMARHGRDVADFMDVLGLSGTGDVIMVGASMGASTIWSYIDLFGTADLQGIVTVDQTPKMSNEDGWDNGFYGYDAANLGTFFADGPPLDTGHGSRPDVRAARLAPLTAALGLQSEDLVPRSLPTTALALLRDHAVQDWRDVIARTDVPALLVAGRESELWPCAHAAATAALNPKASALVIEHCGHAVNVEQPSAFNTILVDFINELA